MDVHLWYRGRKGPKTVYRSALYGRTLNPIGGIAVWQIEAEIAREAPIDQTARAFL